MMVTYEAARDAGVRRAVREILKDEVTHSRLGWAHLAAERASDHGAFVSDLLPNMLAGAASEGLFAPDEHEGKGEARDEQLLLHGELSLSTRRAIFVQTLTQVIFPGFAALGIETGPARAWLAAVVRNHGG
jgi:hypothetical protein